MTGMFYDSKDRKQFREWLKDRGELLLTAIVVSIPLGLGIVVFYGLLHFAKKFW